MENIEQKISISEVEQQLTELVSLDKKSWVKIYELMQEVETDKLYKEQYNSYTAWVNSFAERVKVNVSLLWQRKKAGKYYAEYVERQNKKGNTVIPIEEVKVSPDNFILVEKIACGNQAVADELIDKVVDGKLKRQDLSNAWKTVKAERERAGVKVVRQNAHDMPKFDVGESSMNLANEKKTSITATDIVLAFNKNSWIAERIEKPYVVEKYRIMTEFAVETGTSSHARRMDILALENISAKTKGDVNIHGIEVKVSKSDLLSDKKMQEYREYCDYFWLAVPENLLDDAKNIVVDGWGIITLSIDGSLTVQRQAQRYDAVFRDKTITQALLKLL